MICMARTFGAPDTVPAGKPAISASMASKRGIEPAFHIRDDVHHLAVIFEEEGVGDAHAADLRHAPHIVASEVEQHQMLGALLGIGEQLGRQRLVLLRRGSAAAACRRWGGW